MGITLLQNPMSVGKPGVDEQALPASWTSLRTPRAVSAICVNAVPVEQLFTAVELPGFDLPKGS